MHLVLLAEDFPPVTSGGALVRWQFCRRLVKRGHEVTVFTPRRQGTPRSETSEGVRIERPFARVPDRAPYSAPGILGRLVFSIGLLAHAMWWFRTRDIDGIHSSGYAVHWVGKLLSITYGVPFVPFISYTPSAESDWRPTPRFLLERFNFRFFMGDAVLCRGPSVRRVLKETVDVPVSILHGVLREEAIRNASASVDPDTVRDRFDVPPDGPLVAFVGRLVPIKNPGAAISIFAESGCDGTLLIVGDGPERDALESDIEATGLADRVHFAGEHPHEDALAVIATADVLLVPSRAESYSSVALEGLALGCHVFATPVGVLPEIEHDRLHVGPLEELPLLVGAASLTDQQFLDETVLRDYSLERYTDDVIETFRNLAND